MLLQDLRILKLSSVGLLPPEIADEFGKDAEKVRKTILAQDRTTKCRTRVLSRQDFLLSDKLEITCEVECGENGKGIWEEFQISPRTYWPIIK